jgi:AICAR transformylase/IMP cyclohydrolase PurH
VSLLRSSRHYRTTLADLGFLTSKVVLAGSKTFYNTVIQVLSSWRAVSRAKERSIPCTVEFEHGSPVSRAERKLLKLRPLNLIWIMPAQGDNTLIPCPVHSTERAR